MRRNDDLFYENKKQMKTNKSNLLDKYFTKPDIAKKLFLKSIDIISKYEDVNEYYFLEPSAGNGSFLDVLPKNKSIGLDIDPLRNDIIKQDYLKYDIKKLANYPLIVIGNPPFGHRGVLALEFLKHSKNADFICFILPMFFNSNGKGSIKNRLKNEELFLLYNEVLEPNIFYDINKKEIKVNCVFQIWSKKEYVKNKDDFNWYDKKVPFKNLIEIKTVSLAKKRECGLKYIDETRIDFIKPNFYLSSTFYKENKVVYDFKDVKYQSEQWL